jgi:uncharacterized membrane protein YeaQ/YmgE (transglycosylase-associated protein family)
MSFLWFLLIGGVAGWLAGLAMKGKGFGLIGNVMVGFIGGVLGGWLLSGLGLVPQGSAGSLVSAFLGAVVLLFVVGLLKK